MPYADWALDAARLAVSGTGLSVYETSNWRNRGHGAFRTIAIVTGHHTATPESAPGNYPSWDVVANGRPDLSGPLANFGLGRDGSPYVIARGVAYHAGSSAFRGYVDINDEAVGIEAEDSGDGIWRPEQLVMYPRLVAACLFYMGRDATWYCSHRTCALPYGRKTDPKGIADDWMINQVSIVLAEGFDTMPTAAEIADEVWRRTQPHPHKETTPGSGIGVPIVPKDALFLGNDASQSAAGAIAGPVDDKLDALAQEVASLRAGQETGAGALADLTAKVDALLVQMGGVRLVPQVTGESVLTYQTVPLEQR